MRQMALAVGVVLSLLLPSSGARLGARPRRRSSTSCSHRSLSIRSAARPDAALRRKSRARRGDARMAGEPDGVERHGAAGRRRRGRLRRSFVALALFPDVIGYMATQAQWTTSLGKAFSENRSAVFDSIQRLRAKAKAAGTLKSTPQQQVETQTTVERPAGHRRRAGQPAGRLRAAVQPADGLYDADNGGRRKGLERRRRRRRA